MPTIVGTNNAETLTGTEDADIIYGLGGGDTIYGLGGNDFIDGGNGGPDKMYGGLGDDTYYVDTWNEKVFISDNDLIFENAGEGFDRVAASVSYRLGGTNSIELIEAVNLSDTSNIYLYGNDIGQTIVGNAGDNILIGEGGNDVIVGGAGRDTMWGDGFSAFGDDIFYVDNVGDHVIEFAGQGFDRVYTTVSFTLEREVEWLQAADENGTDPLVLAGNEYAQTVIGNAGGNILYGFAGDDDLRGLAGNDYLFGGDGADTLRGGTGDDTYYVDGGDIVDEVAGQGFDRVAATASFFATAGAAVELIEPVNAGGSEAMDLGGSDFAQTINGNGGTNILYGRGGDDILRGYGGDDYLVGGAAGSTDHDQMLGGAGNDTYYVFSSADSATELAGEGNDRVATKVSLILNPLSEIESLEAGDSTATDALALTGSDTANAIVGNAGDNFIDGRGGSDILVGLGGSDTYAFTSNLGPGNVDTIDQFAPGSDRIALDDAVFTGIGAPGALSAAAFATGAGAADSSDRIVYNAATGQLFYDSDGNGAAAQIQFAALAPGLALSSTDFIVI